jgi:hypothetical protein
MLALIGFAQSGKELANAKHEVAAKISALGSGGARAEPSS